VERFVTTVFKPSHQLRNAASRSHVLIQVSEIKYDADENCDSSLKIIGRRDQFKRDRINICRDGIYLIKTFAGGMATEIV
jgi:hypothetical protein